MTNEVYYVLNANEIQGTPITITSLADGNIFAYSSSAGAWINRVTIPATAGVDSVNSLTGAVTIGSPNSTLTFGTSSQEITVDLNLAEANTWTGVQTFTQSAFYLSGSSTGHTILNSGLSSTSNNTLTLPTTASDTLAGIGTAQTWSATQSFNSTLFVATSAPSPSSSQGGIWNDSGTEHLRFGYGSTVANYAFLDNSGDLNIAGNMNVASGKTYEIDGTSIFGTANTWSALQTFGNEISFGGAALDVTSLTTNDFLQFNGTNWVNVTAPSSGVSSVSNSDSTLTISPTTGSVVASLDLANANTWSGLQSGTVRASSLASGSVDGTTIELSGNAATLNLGNANTWTGLQTFGTDISFMGAQLSGTKTTGGVLYYNATNWVCSSEFAINGSGIISTYNNVSTSGNIGSAVVYGSGLETLLTSTNPTTITTFTPGAVGLFRVSGYYRVVTATTTATVSCTWTSPSGSQTYTWASAVGDTTGDYILLPITIVSAASDAITISMTAGTANQIYGSAVIEQVA